MQVKRSRRLVLVFLALGLLRCAGAFSKSTPAQNGDIAKGPWSEVPVFAMPTGDTSIPIDLLRDVADALLKRGGAHVCDPVTKMPITGLSTEYCLTVYVAGGRDNLTWRVTEPVEGSAKACNPYFVIRDEEFPSSQIWVVGFIHNHPCATGPSSDDLAVWPTDKFDPYVAMAEVRLIPGNPVPALYKDIAIEMASALVAERQDGTRVFLRYFPTGEVQQWSKARSDWVTLGFCAPRGEESIALTPRCDEEPLKLLRE